MSAPPPVLEAHDLCASYRHQPVLHGVDVAFPAGVLVGLLGPNGAGKSSFLKAVMGELRPDSGWVKLFGLPVEEARKRVAYVPQRESVDWDFPVTVADVALMGTYGGLGWWRRPGKAERERAMEALDRVGMTPFAKRPIGELSGGQQQRVFVARALAQDAGLLLMDEPFAGVDAATEEAVIGVLRELRDAGRTVLVVHHDLQTAPKYFDHLMLLNLRLIACGPVEQVFTRGHLEAAYGGRLTLLSEVASRAAGKAPL
jgi:manganese/zinc/iron transport system ATP- binding protein